MRNKLTQLPVYFTVVVLLAGIILTGCSAGSASQAPSSTTPTTSTTSQPAAPAQQAGTTTGQQGGQQGGPQGGQDMQALQKKLLARVAEILGVSSDSLTTAYEAAIKSVMGDKAPSGPAPQGGTPPSGSSQGTPPQPPADGKSGGPGGQGKTGPDMSGVYSKVASALGLTTEKVQAAFEQAQKEIMPARTQ